MVRESTSSQIEINSEFSKHLSIVDAEDYASLCDPGGSCLLAPENLVEG
jgi:hypothetical protein